MSTRGPKWSDEEVLVLVTIYFNAKFSIGDDAREECQLIADCFGRTPGSIDRQWRNISTIVNESGTSNVGLKLRNAVNEFLNDPETTRKIAGAIVKRHEWPLGDLLVHGGISPSFSDASDTSKASAMRLIINDQVDNLDYKIFQQGAHGYSLDMEVNDALLHFYFSISSVLQGSSHLSKVDMATSRLEMVGIISKILPTVPVKQSKNNRLIMHHSVKVVQHGERFLISIRANELERRIDGKQL